jgi:hypothetical protein
MALIFVEDGKDEIISDAFFRKSLSSSDMEVSRKVKSYKKGYATFLKK